MYFAPKGTPWTARLIENIEHDVIPRYCTVKVPHVDRKCVLELGWLTQVRPDGA